MAPPWWFLRIFWKGPFSFWRPLAPFDRWVNWVESIDELQFLEQYKLLLKYYMRMLENELDLVRKELDLVMKRIEELRSKKE